MGSPPFFPLSQRRRHSRINNSATTRMRHHEPHLTAVPLEHRYAHDQLALILHPLDPTIYQTAG